MMYAAASAGLTGRTGWMQCKFGLWYMVNLQMEN